MLGYRVQRNPMEEVPAKCHAALKVWSWRADYVTSRAKCTTRALLTCAGTMNSALIGLHTPINTRGLAAGKKGCIIFFFFVEMIIN